MARRHQPLGADASEAASIVGRTLLEDGLEVAGKGKIPLGAGLEASIEGGTPLGNDSDGRTILVIVSAGRISSGGRAMAVTTESF